MNGSSENGANFWISPNYRVNDWKEARDNDDFKKMIAIFKDRLEGRFLEPIRLIVNCKDKKIGNFSGFSILALDCLIIETLQQFYNGKNETKGSHSKAFWCFFKSSPFFTKSFSTEKEAEIFYGHFRCGLLHQAQTKKKSLIRTGKKLPMISPVSGNLDEGLIVNREKFHEAIEKEIKRYMELLDSGDKELRNCFVKKMNYICNLA